MNKKPVIGIVSVSHQLELLLPVYCTTAHYLEQVKAAGGIPMQIPIIEHTKDEDFQQIISLCDGFLLPGGGDFSPEWYGEELLDNLSPDTIELSKEVQDAALRFIRLLASSNKPVLGICLGIQLMNIALGGNLYQDIPSQRPSELIHAVDAKKLEDRWITPHQVIIKEGSLLDQITNLKSFKVNSFHHQALKDVAPCFEITAWSEDGIAEAIENTSKTMLGVQWHAENLAHADFPEAKSIFQWLVSKATTTY